MAKEQRGASRNQALNSEPVVRDWSTLIKRLFISLFIVLFILAIWFARQADLFPVKHIALEGTFNQVNKTQLMAAVDPYVKGGFFSVDVGAVRQAGKKLPWVNKLEVKRVWPDTVNIIVTEQKAIARWNQHELINSTGAVFKPAVTSLPNDLIQLNGPKGMGKAMAEQLASFHKKLIPIDLHITEMDMDERHVLQLHCSDGLTIKLGGKNTEQRLQRFIAVYQQYLIKFKPDIQAIDMRYPNGLAVVWVNGKQPNLNGAA